VVANLHCELVCQEKKNKYFEVRMMIQSHWEEEEQGHRLRGLRIVQDNQAGKPYSLRATLTNPIKEGNPKTPGELTFFVNLKP
jgi:hypothetical protein